MVTTLEDGERRLAELVERASQGEDVLITVGGKVRARLTQVEEEADAGDSASEQKRWAGELRAYQRDLIARGAHRTLSEQQMWDELREDRV